MSVFWGFRRRKSTLVVDVEILRRGNVFHWLCFKYGEKILGNIHPVLAKEKGVIKSKEHVFKKYV